VRFDRDGRSSLTAFAAEHGYGVIEDYQSEGPDDLPRRIESVKAKVRAVESVALRDRYGLLVGVLTLFSGTPGFFRAGVNEISLSLVARDLANIIEAKRLEDEIRLAGITDSLTGLYNTRHFYRRLSDEMKRAERTGRPLTVMLFDLDNFKEYNDRDGHVAGDHLLRRIADIVTGSLREGSDLAFRYGGDEFVVLLPETDLARARRVAARIRRQVESIPSAGVSTSIGLAERSGEASPEELVRRADRAMYRAKTGGKNRVVADRDERAS
jgi:diguanylate cyclase (GGDEF)-like protein